MGEWSPRAHPVPRGVVLGVTPGWLWFWGQGQPDWAPHPRVPFAGGALGSPQGVLWVG